MPHQEEDIIIPSMNSTHLAEELEDIPLICSQVDIEGHHCVCCSLHLLEVLRQASKQAQKRGHTQKGDH